MQPCARLLVADDHAIVREGLCRLLATHPGFCICGEASDGRTAVEKSAELSPDVVLMDIGMPGMDGIEATSRIKDACPGTRILILTAYEDKNLVRLALKAGADGYLLKNADRDKLAQAINAVLDEGRYFEPDLHITPLPDDGEDEDGQFAVLTRREKEILALVAGGLKNREISDKLCISVKTVEKHRANLMKKLDLHSVAELVSFALKADFLLR
ncbi:two component transcriptional regulator, LuxR family [Desulfovibrio sp. X2]|uniref:response regulator n=1 Tax=Desulfovibrio sp. X2 TaxID=941449 RepID=UPI0003589204|nr:response regulator transcription factor [Desulfovibrio sp. X2]EPR44701.1 two component transcriptional regulator, LuxR family [Desulfovibrio sp. X2]